MNRLLYIKKKTKKPQQDNFHRVQDNDQYGDRQKKTEAPTPVGDLVKLSDQVEKHPNSKAKLDKQQQEWPGSKQIVLLI